MTPFFIIIPLAAAFIMVAAAKLDERLQDALACVSGMGLLSLSIMTAIAVGRHTGGVLVYKIGNWMPPFGVSLVVDGLTAFMLITVNLVALFIVLFATGYMKKYTDKWKFYTLFCFMLAGVNGVLVAGDIFNLYVFMEIAAISAYFLVAFGAGAEELEASFKYAVMGTVASCFIFLGIAFLYGYTSTLNMADMSVVIAAKGPARLLQFVSVLFLMGFGLKAALVPFHAWLAYAHSSAPAPVSAMLSGVLIKVLGIYALSRIFFGVFGMTPEVALVLIALAVLSMIVGGILAFGQTDIKRLFAYSTVSQIGYIALGLGIGTPLAIFGALFYLFNHSLFKSLLFLNSGSIECVTGTRNMSKMSGVLSKAPITGYTSLVAALSICGIPPLGGFWAKLIIILACVQAHRPVLAAVAALVSVLTLAYYFKSLTPVLFGGNNEPEEIKTRPSLAMNAAMAALAGLVVLSVFMLVPGPGKTLMNNAVSTLIKGVGYAGATLGALR